jgi:hypothetical protein
MAGIPKESAHMPNPVQRMGQCARGPTPLPQAYEKTVPGVLLNASTFMRQLCGISPN